MSSECPRGLQILARRFDSGSGLQTIPTLYIKITPSGAHAGRGRKYPTQGVDAASTLWQTVAYRGYSTSAEYNPEIPRDRNREVPKMHTQAQDDYSTADLIDAQRLMELRASKDGYDRYIKQQRSTVDSVGGHSGAEAVKIIKGSIPLVSAKITEWIEENDTGGRGKRHKALPVLKQLDPDLLAFISLNSVFAGITKVNKLAAVQNLIGGQVEAEIIAARIAAANGAKVAKRVKDVIQRNGSGRQRSKIFKKLASEHLPNDDEGGLTQDVKVRIAEPLLNAVLLGVPDLFEVVTLSVSKNKRETILRLTDEGVQLFASLRESMAWMQPIHRPMVVPPRPWADMNTGCYYEERAARTVKLVRTYDKGHKRLLRQAIADGQMDYVLSAVNAIQETPWAINSPIVDLVRHCFEVGILGVGLPANCLMDIPEKVGDAAWEAMTPKQRKGHKITLAGIHERNRSVVSDQAVLLRDLETADELVKYHSFWLPHNLDFRGRVYPVPHFSHQRQDHVKAMFQFAYGNPLGEYGAGWLSIHLANCGDFDKMSKASFDERLDWVAANELLILRIGKDPYATIDDWKQADSPFMFVAACMDYYGWVQSGRSDGYISHLAVALDGSNSGLQHYSAALRATDEAALVSLIPCDKPADLYQTVADQVRAEVEREAAEGSEIARQVLEAGINRSIVKRNVMTFAYSSEQFGFRQQLMDDLMRPINEEVFLGRRETNPYAMHRVNKDTGEIGDLDGGFSASGYIAAKVWHAVTKTVTKATEGMDFFKRLAATLAHEKQPLIWTTPLGLPVVHRYSVWETKTVEMFMFDRKVPVVDAGSKDRIAGDGVSVLKRVQTNIRTAPTDRIDKDKARSAVAPNVIHSMDGAHLMLTVLNAHEEGLTDFALIHDSFGTHAGSTHRFFQVIRESFVEMYSDYCPFEETIDFALSVLSPDGIEKLPPIPSKGDMGLTQVLDADYAFA
jgi:DNA-directed RNA polymerase, mitochondrial